MTASPTAFVEDLRAEGIEATIYGPAMERDGVEVDEWLLVVSGEVVARGAHLGGFRKAVQEWMRSRPTA